MGCGSSKGVVPQEPVTAASASPLKSHCATAQGASEATSDVASLHKQQPAALQQQEQHDGAVVKQQHLLQDVSLPGRIDSTTGTANPPLLKELSEVEDLPPARQDPVSAAADADFDYGKELQHGAAFGSQNHSAAPGTVVGGLLAKQPDWLSGGAVSATSGQTSGAAGPSASESLGSKLAPAPAGALPPLAQGPAAGKASALPPLVGRGVAGSSLPPLGSRGVTGAVGAEHNQQKRRSQDTPLELSHTGSSAQHSAAGEPLKRSSSPGSSVLVGCISHEVVNEPELPGSSRSSSRSTSPAAKPASATAAAATDPSDPWSALQSQYTHGSPSPDSSMAGGGPQVLGGDAAHSKVSGKGHDVHSAAGPVLPPLFGSGNAAEGVNRGAAPAAVRKSHQELVLDEADTEDEQEVHHPGQQQQHEQHPMAHEVEDYLLEGATKDLKGSSRSVSATGDGKLSAQPSQQSVNSSGPHVAKSGGWGVGSLAGAGTIMLGNEHSSTKVAVRKPGMQQAIVRHDDVFGDDANEAPVQAKPVAVTGLAAETSRISNLRSSNSRVRVGASAPVPAQEALDVEEFDEEVDAAAESELAQDGLPADLAAKLAQFEATKADADSDDGGVGSGAESDGPSVYALMNHKQGSWRAA